MFGEMAGAYLAIAPDLTSAQRDILSRNIVSREGQRPRGLADLGCRPGHRDMSLNCGPAGP